MPNRPLFAHLLKSMNHIPESVRAFTVIGGVWDVTYVTKW